MKNSPIRFFYVVLLVFTSLACKEETDLGMRPYKKKENAAGGNRDCRLTAFDRVGGLNFRVRYEGDRITELTGFSLFDRFFYQNGKLTEAKNTANPDWPVKFQSDSKGNITGFTIEGKDEVGNLVENRVVMIYDGNDRIVEMTIDLQSMRNVKVKLEYDSKGNVTEVKQLMRNQYETILKNLAFDDLKSPFVNSQLRQILAYFSVYTLILGDANYTGMLSVNNPTVSVITNANGTVELNAEYEERTGYAAKASISQNINGRLRSLTETYSLECN